MADDLISRQAALDAVKFKTIDDGGVVDDCIMQVLALAKSKINKLPTADAAEVVRCGECIHRHEGRRPFCQGRRPDWFCADGIRRGSK